MPKATIAVIEGRVGGGGSELALSCDMRFAALGRAVFNQPEVALGILPGGSGTVRLPRLVGRSRALEVILGCDDVPAELAERWGWVNRALPPDELWPFVDRLARAHRRLPAARRAPRRRRPCCAPRRTWSADLLAEGGAFNATLGDPSTVERWPRSWPAAARPRGRTAPGRAGRRTVGHLVDDRVRCRISVAELHERRCRVQCTWHRVSTGGESGVRRLEVPHAGEAVERATHDEAGPLEHVHAGGRVDGAGGAVPRTVGLRCALVEHAGAVVGGERRQVAGQLAGRGGDRAVSAAGASVAAAKATAKNVTGATMRSARPLPVASNAGSGAGWKSPVIKPPSVPGASSE